MNILGEQEDADVEDQEGAGIYQHVEEEEDCHLMSASLQGEVMRFGLGILG